MPSSFTPPRPLRHSTAPVLASIILLAVYVLAFAQRQLPAALAVPLSRTFNLSDSVFGAFHGYGFALIYAGAALPAGWLVDRYPRLRLLTVGVLIAGIATAAHGIAGSLAALFAVRMLLGAGQAVIVPAAYSLLGDYFPPRRVGVAVAGFAVGPFIGTGLSLVASGWLVSAGWDWRMPFLIVGLAALPLCVVLSICVEPARRAVADRSVHVGAVRFGPYVRLHWRAVATVDGAMVMTTMGSHIMLGWSTVWLIRTHHMPLDLATYSLGFAVLVGGITGTLTVGVVSDAVIRRVPSVSRMHIHAIACLIAACAGYLVFRLDLPGFGTTAMMSILMLFLAAALATGPAALQDITPPQLRGQQHGTTVFLVNMLGLGLGPLAIGLGSDVANDSYKSIGTMLSWSIPGLLTMAGVVGLFGARAHRASVIR